MREQIAFPWEGESGPRPQRFSCDWFDLLKAYCAVLTRQWEQDRLIAIADGPPDDLHEEEEKG